MGDRHDAAPNAAPFGHLITGIGRWTWTRGIVDKVQFVYAPNMIESHYIDTTFQ
jgi:hypothetical protein